MVSLGFEVGVRGGMMAAVTGAGLWGNLIFGWLLQRVPVLRLAGLSLVIFAAGLVGIPAVAGSSGGLYTVSAAIGFGGGAMTVIFFSGFAKLFGRGNLGRIQGLAQAVTVAASGTGPLFFPRTCSSVRRRFRIRPHSTCWPRSLWSRRFGVFFSGEKVTVGICGTTTATRRAKRFLRPPLP